MAVKGEGKLILCAHGFPELWYSWRHQIDHFSARGYKVAAMDVRGYGGSSKPPEISAYSMRNLAADVAAVIDRLGNGAAILFGHDWGAPIVWNTSLLYPAKVMAVAGLSVPYIPRGEASFIKMARSIYAGRFFYQLYFQEEGVAEVELESDIPTALRKLYFGASGDAPLNALLADKPSDDRPVALPRLDERGRAASLCRRLPGRWFPRPTQPLQGPGDRFHRLRRLHRQTGDTAVLLHRGRTRPGAPVHPRD